MIRPAILDTLLAQIPGAVVFEKGIDNLNIIFERRLPGRVDYYDDLVHLVGRNAAGDWYDEQAPCTCDPGLPSLVPGRTTRPSGTAIVQPHQTHGSHRIGLHHGHPALVMVRCPPLWRDREDDGQVDRSGPTYYDGQGINHHCGGRSEHVGPWSEGCLVTPESLGGVPSWAPHWAIIDRAARRWGPLFTTSLVETTEVGP